MSSKKDIRSLNEDELKEILTNNSFKSFRANQIYHWIWKKSAHSFDEMSNLPESLMKFLKDNFVINFTISCYYMKLKIRLLKINFNIFQ